jgi:hypothetical protein
MVAKQEKQTLPRDAHLTGCRMFFLKTPSDEVKGRFKKNMLHGKGLRAFGLFCRQVPEKPPPLLTYAVHIMEFTLSPLNVGSNRESSRLSLRHFSQTRSRKTKNALQNVPHTS